MKRNKWLQLLMSAVASVWISGTLSVTALRALGIEGGMGVALLACVLAAGFGVLSSINRITAILSGVAAMGGGAWLILSKFGALQELAQALPEVLVNGAGSASVQMLLPMIAVLGAVWGLCVFACTHSKAGGFLSAVFTLLYWLLLRAVGGAIEIPMMLATLVGVAALFAVPVAGVSNYAKSLLPTALIAAVLAVMLMPAEGTTYPPLENLADKVRGVFNSYFAFTDTRVPYSISMDGYHPLGETLGGPAEPNQWPVMQVVTDTNLYLRGTIRRTYVNTAWTDAMVSNRYLFSDLTKQGVRGDVFEDDRIDPDASGGAFERIQAEIDMMTAGTSTLFVPHRLEKLGTALDTAAYFNTVGDVFITRDVQEGDSYSIEAVVPTGDKIALQAYIENRHMADDPLYAEAAANYTQLPNHIEQGVYEIVYEITAGALTDYQKAAAIERYLKQNYEYTLDVDMPRNDRDFVSEFLLGSKKGYCSYFASAMAVMGRIAGLPTRYVEGYRVEAMPLGTTTVTGENAHAWVEVYMNGVGWVTFDPTPSRAQDAAEQHETEDPNENQPTEEPTAAPPVEGEPTEEPTIPPMSDEPTPEPLEGTENPSAEPTVTPEPPPSEPDAEEPTPAPEIPEDDQRNEKNDDRDWLKWLLFALIAALLLILLLLLFAAMRLKMSDPHLVAAKYHGNATMQLMVYYRAMLTLLEMQGQVPESGESPMAFGRRQVRAGIAEKGFMEFTARLAYGQYAGKGAEAADVALAGRVYASLVRQLRAGEKLRWRWTRIRRGLGSVEQIP